MKTECLVASVATLLWCCSVGHAEPLQSFEGSVIENQRVTGDNNAPIVQLPSGKVVKLGSELTDVQNKKESIPLTIENKQAPFAFLYLVVPPIGVLAALVWWRKKHKRKRRRYEWSTYRR
jgi:hypothetical protein